MRVRPPVLILIGAAAALTAATLTATPALAAQTPSLSSNVTRSCAVPSKAHVMSCDSLRRTDLASPISLSPDATPSGFGPPDLQSAYSLSTSGASGVTVAIVDAYNDPNAESDLATYRSQYGLPACTTANGCFSKVSQTGSTTSLPTNDSGWAGEISLDVDMVSAICPNCHILLVEANSASDTDLYTAEDY